MKVHKGFINKLAENKFLQIGEIILELKVVREENRSLINVYQKFTELESIFYTVDFLKQNNLIVFGKNNLDGITFPITSKIEDATGDELVNYGKTVILEKYIKEYWGQEIFVKPIFYKYIDNGFKTDEEKEKFYQILVPIFAALVAAFFTAVLTKYFSSPDCLIKL